MELGKFTKTPYLVLFIVLIAIGVGTASALITITLSGDVIITGDLDMTNGKISNLVTPSVPADAATKGYVDSAPGTDTLALLGCADGEIAKFDGNGWACGVDVDTDTVPWNSNVPQSTSLTTVDSILTTTGTFTSITIGADGLPIMSYHASPGGTLKVAHCGNVSCSSGNTLVTVDSAGQSHTSIAIGTDGFAVIGYHGSNQDLKVAHCTNTSCSTSTTTTIDSADHVGDDVSITIGADGFPILSYRNFTGSDLKVAHCTNTSCSTFDTPTTVDSGGVGFATSISIGTDGFAVISYHGFTNGGDVKVAHCTNTSCSTFDTPTILTTSVQTDTSITIGIDGFPMISYLDTLPFILKVAHCGNVSCSSGNTLVIVDSTAQVGDHSSITIGTDGLPVISYTDDDNQDLKVAKCTNPYCLNNWIRR